MRNFFFSHLAASNLVKNRKLYLPYMLMNIGIILMFYVMHAIASNEGLSKMKGASATIAMLFLGTIVVGIFASILVFYTNSFLLKQRQKEIGLYNILGMEKRHIGKMLGMEALIVALVCLVLGIGSGIVLSKLMFMGLLKIMAIQTPLLFSISFNSIWITFVFFSILFLITLIYNVARMHLINPVSLLKGGQVGEKEPKTKWLMAILGFTALGYGYYLAQSVDNPMSAITTFFFAVLLVIFATYNIFTFGSIMVLKMLRKNKKFYYKSKHFVAVSGMIYRMKQNASGLASICILSCAVLVSVSTTVSMYVGMDDMLRSSYPRDFKVTFFSEEEGKVEEGKQTIMKLAEKHKVVTTELLNYSEKGTMIHVNQDKWTAASRENFRFDELSVVIFVTAEEMGQIEGKTFSVGENELKIYGNNMPLLKDTAAIGNEVYQITKDENSKLKIQDLYGTNFGMSVIAMVKDSAQRDKIMLGIDGKSSDYKEIFAFDLDEDEENNKKFASEVQSFFSNKDEFFVDVDSRDLARDEFIGIYGGFFFIGTFLGLLFLMATAMIIYYKQMSEGFDDQARYEILQKVGMSQDEIKTSINRQIVMVFFLPLLTAIVHIGFAFNVIEQMLTVFGLQNTQLFITCTLATIGVFALIYFAVYKLTAKAYYKLLIVNV